MDEKNEELTIDPLSFYGKLLLALENKNRDVLNILIKNAQSSQLYECYKLAKQEGKKYLADLLAKTLGIAKRKSPEMGREL